MVPKQVTSRSLIYLRGILLSCLLVLLLLAPSACLAALRFDVFVGYDGILPDKGWFPITCELQNDGPAFNAVIEVSAEQMGQGQTRRVKLDLPTGSLKRIVIPVFSGAQSWNVRLLDERDHVRAEQTTLRAKVLPPDLPLVVGVCRTVHGLPVFPEMPARYQGATASSYGAARLTPELFPDNPLAMESIDLLYLNSEKALALSLPQATALKAWLEHGGHLVVGVEQSSDISGNPWLHDLMPCEVTSARNLTDHSQLQAWLHAPWTVSRFQQPIRQPNNFNGLGGTMGAPPMATPIPIYPVEIHGTVFSPDGKTVEGATVYLGQQNGISGLNPSAQAATDKDGKFTLAGNAGNLALVAAFSPDFGPVMQSVPTVKGAGPVAKNPALVELRMTAPQTNRFRVTDAAGKPVAGANGRVPRWENFSYPPPWDSFTTDAEGRFVMTNAPTDSFTLQVTGTGGSAMAAVNQMNQDTNEIALQLGVGGRRGGVGLVPTPNIKPVQIHGTVLSPDGKPVEGATVYLGMQNVIRGLLGQRGMNNGVQGLPKATTDKDGKFTLAANTTSVALISAFSPDFGPVIKSVPTANGSAPVELRMTPARSVGFRVLDPAGNPVSGANGTVTSWGNFNYPPLWNSFLSDAEGKFVMTNAPTDGFTLMVTGSAGGAIVMVQPRGDTNEITVQLDPNGPSARGFPGGRGGRRGGAGFQFAQTQPVAPTIVPEDPDFEAAPLPILTGPLIDGTILIGDEAAPLAVTAERGRGRITVLAFSPEREPFLSWKDRGLFWAKLAGIPQSRLSLADNNPNLAQLGTDGIFGAMIDSKQVRKLPLSWLLLLLAAYLVVIGPLDQYWLKKLNRQMLTWVTFPLYVVAFSGLIYLIGFHLRAGELEWNELNIVDVFPGEDRAVLRGETYVSIYSPVNAHFGMASSQPYATLRGESAGLYGGRQESSQVAVVQIGNTFQAQAFVPVWTSQLFVSDWLQASPLDPLTLSAAKKDSGWSVTITNQTARPLTHTHLTVGGRLYDLGELAPQQTKTFSLNTSDGTVLNSFTSQYANSFHNAVNSRRNSFGNNNGGIANIEEASMATSFLAEDPGDPNQVWNNFNVSPNLDLTRFTGADHAVLLAWDADHSFADSINPIPIKRTHRNTLLRLVVPVKTP